MNFHEKAHPIEADVAAVVVERNGSAPLVPADAAAPGGFDEFAFHRVR
jgi:hypothetical protein